MLCWTAFPALADLLLFMESMDKCYMIKITESIDKWFFLFFNSISGSIYDSTQICDWLFIVDWTKYVASAYTSLFKHELVILQGHYFV